MDRLAFCFGVGGAHAGPCRNFLSCTSQLRDSWEYFFWGTVVPKKPLNFNFARASTCSIENPSTFICPEDIWSGKGSLDRSDGLPRPAGSGFGFADLSPCFKMGLGFRAAGCILF